MTERVEALPIGFSDRLKNWREVLLTGNLREGRVLDGVSRWLILTRAAVFPMTIVSAALGALLAAGDGAANGAACAVCLIGVLSAHACNNLMNDYFDLEGGVDTRDYPRALYAPHPVLSGWISKEGLLGAIAVANAVGAATMIVLWWWRGWPILAFAGAGLFLSVFYVAPPLRLKHRGLGEPSVVIVWGPLMTCGSYYAVAGSLPGEIWLASLPYALLVGTVLIGKHVDKFPYDSGKGIRTLPVILGEERSLFWNRVLMIAFFPLVIALVAVGILGFWALLTLLALPRLRSVLKIYSEPRPESCPENYPVWPLWYVAATFWLTRGAGGLFVLGLALDWLVPLG